VYFRGIPPGGVGIRSLWHNEVEKAVKRQKASPPPAVAQEQEARAVEAIRIKLRAGKKLSPAEFDFLRERAPELYSKAVRVARERDAYEKSLRRSKSKAEAKVIENQMLARLAHLNRHSDPEEAEMLLSAVQDANREHKRSREYALLGDDEK